jgi:ATP-dependent helicase Lhr and Lhr-like helicase
MSSPNAFQRLAPFVQEFVYRQDWKELRSLQVLAIDALFDSEDDVLITTGTASGKTEAAFLPILSMISEEPTGSIRALYIGPLKALINDQFRRLEILCEKGDIPIHRWHGDVGASQKSDLVEHPGGVLQITPESIESLFINKTNHLRRLFGGLRFIVVDEVHSFLEADRGVQLRSQLQRIEQYAAATSRPRRIGLSATVGDSQMARQWLNPQYPEKVRIINPEVDVSPVRLSHLHFNLTKQEIPSEMIDDLYTLTKNRRALIFCNTRGLVEVMTAELNRRSARDHVPEHYLPHHGSVSKEIRDDAERRMRDDDHPTTVICTNTLELGIDIGQLDLAVQIDSTHTVMSFVQRLGRTGRRQDASRIMQIYTSELQPQPNDEFYERLPFAFLKALAVVDLFLEGWLEPPAEKTIPYNVLYHQMLSRLVETHGSSAKDLVAHFLNSGVFPGVTSEDYFALLKHLGSIDHIEQLENGELILGLAGEKILRSKDFYAVFATPPEWDVFYKTRVLGRISPRPNLTIGTCLLLVGRVWEVKDILTDKQQIFVEPAAESRDVMFLGVGIPDMHPKVAQRVREFLLTEKIPTYVGKVGQQALAEARRLSQELNLGKTQIFDTADKWIIFLWTGTRSARTLQYWFQLCGFIVEFPSMMLPWVMSVEKANPGESKMEFLTRLKDVEASGYELEDIVRNIPIELLLIHKFDEYIPEDLIRARAGEEWLDWEQVKIDLKGIISLPLY